jgi:hypothetical protein
MTISSETHKMIHSALSSGMVFQSQLPLMDASDPYLRRCICQIEVRGEAAKSPLRNPPQARSK